MEKTTLVLSTKNVFVIITLSFVSDAALSSFSCRRSSTGFSKKNEQTILKNSKSSSYVTIWKGTS
jgi:hypothetical protein